MISVICPTYNSAKFVEKTLATVVQQTVLSLELIVSDDGSNDLTTDVVRQFLSSHASFPWIVLENPHQGPGAARNAAIKAASSDWIAFLDSDDLWIPNKIERVLRIMKDYPDANIFCHNYHHRLLNGNCVPMDMANRYVHGVSVPKQMFHNCLFTTSGVTVRKDLLFRYGLFDETFPSAQDYELWLRLSPALKPHFIQEALGYYVDRPQNISSKHPLWHLRNVLRGLIKNRYCVSRYWLIYALSRHTLAYMKRTFLPR